MPTRCPECAGIMKWVLKKYTCQRCGLTLSQTELDDMNESLRDRAHEEKTKDDIDRKRKKEYLDWYLSSKKEE